jgi:hypothetical protein
MAADTLIAVALSDPVAQTRLRDPEIAGDLRHWLLPQPGQLNSAPTELRRMRTRHCGLLPRRLRVPSR